MANERVLIGRRKCVSAQKIRNISFRAERRTGELFQKILEFYLIATENKRLQQLKQQYGSIARRYRMTKKQCGFGNWRPAGCKKLTAESSSKKAAVRKQFVMDVIQQTALRVRNGLIGAAMVGLAYFGGGLGDHHYLRSLHPVAIGTDVCDRRKQTYAIISGSAIRGIGLMLRSGTLRGAERLRVSTSVH